MARWYWQSDLRKRAADTDEDAWTMYSPTDSVKIEKAFSKGQKTLSLNDTYSIVFSCMEQQRKDDRSRRRFIRREVLGGAKPKAPVKTKVTASKKRTKAAVAAEEEEEEEEAPVVKGGRGGAAKSAKTTPKTSAAPKKPTMKLTPDQLKQVFSDESGGTTDTVIAQAEKGLKRTLPLVFKSLMKVQNGGTMSDEKSCIAAKNTTWAATHVAIESIIPVEELVEDQKNWVDEWEYPDIGIYFGNCPSGGHDMIALDYRTCGPKVVNTA